MHCRTNEHTSIAFQIRTPTATTIVAATAQTRRPVLSVRRRKINTPTLATSGIAYQTATTKIQSSAAAIITTANTYPTKSDELLGTTTELPTTFNKQPQQYRNRIKLVTPAATTTSTTYLSAPTTTTSVTVAVAALTLNSDAANGTGNQKNYLNTKYRAKLSATTLSTGASPTTLVTVTPAAKGAATATAATTLAINDIIQHNNANTNTKQASTVLRRKFQARRLITTTTASPTDDS
ncbi:PREDICTED: salivary glue protein Sgs-3-like, partial [Rhagoletis zephyria]|uniref:salivary glue protein Sgs-3-like n=1 Tax=Rhagoletis zephyria TaxID=28612 RepID=UPI0008114029